MYIKQAFGITGGWLISIFALIVGIMFVFKISIKDLISNIKAKSNGISETSAKINRRTAYFFTLLVCKNPSTKRKQYIGNAIRPM